MIKLLHQHREVKDVTFARISRHDVTEELILVYGGKLADVKYMVFQLVQELHGFEERPVGTHSIISSLEAPKINS